jgi:hypothetical protein
MCFFAWRNSGCGVEQRGAKSVDPTGASTEGQGVDQLAVKGPLTVVIQKIHDSAPPKIHTFLDQVSQALFEQHPSLLGELLRFTGGEQLVEHRVQPLCHCTHQANQGFGINWIELLPARGAAKGVVAPPLPEFNTIWKLGLKPHLVACPQHCFSTVEVEGLNREE